MNELLYCGMFAIGGFVAWRITEAAARAYEEIQSRIYEEINKQREFAHEAHCKAMYSKERTDKKIAEFRAIIAKAESFPDDTILALHPDDSETLVDQKEIGRTDGWPKVHFCVSCWHRPSGISVRVERENCQMIDLRSEVLSELEYLVSRSPRHKKILKAIGDK